MTGMAKVSASWYYGAHIKCKICHPFPYYQRSPLRRGDRAFAYGNNVHEYVFSSKCVSRPSSIDPLLPVCLSTIRIGHRVLRTNVKQVDGLEFFVVKGNYINLRKRRSCNVDIRIIRGCLTRRYPINEIEIAALSAALLS